MSLHRRDPVVRRIDAVLAEHELLGQQGRVCAADPDDRPVADEPQPFVVDHPRPVVGVPPVVVELTAEQVADLERQLLRKFAKGRHQHGTTVLDQSTDKWVPVRRSWWRRLTRPRQ